MSGYRPNRFTQDAPPPRFDTVKAAREWQAKRDAELRVALAKVEASQRGREGR